MVVRKEIKRFFQNRKNRYCKEDILVRRFPSATPETLIALSNQGILTTRMYKNYREYKLKKQKK